MSKIEPMKFNQPDAPVAPQPPIAQPVAAQPVAAPSEPELHQHNFQKVYAIGAAASRAKMDAVFEAHAERYQALAVGLRRRDDDQALRETR